MTVTIPQNIGRPQGISLQKDVDDFLKTMSDCYANHDLDQIMRHISHDFLHQGMDKTAFGERLRQSYLLKYVDWMKITILNFHIEANEAGISGFAETNLGIMPASEELLPLIEGSRLILESGEWKLLGNQSKSTQGLYKDFHQLTAYFAPRDLSLYRSLLPPYFEVPLEPMVFVKVTDYSRVYSPLRPYKMAHVQILVEYEGMQGWHTLTMPETDWMPVEMGKTIGYPKYVADSIVIERLNSGWEGNVENEGEKSIAFSIKFEEDHTQASWFERVTSNHPMIILRKLLPSSREKPWFLTMPIQSKDALGEVLLLGGEPLISGAPKLQETFGTVHLSMETNQPWAGLFHPEVIARGVFMQFSGEIILNHRPIARLGGTANSA